MKSYCLFNHVLSGQKFGPINWIFDIRSDDYKSCRGRV